MGNQVVSFPGRTADRGLRRDLLPAGDAGPGIVDPVSVVTAVDLAGCLQSLRARRGYSYAELDRRARALPRQAGRVHSLPRSTVSDAVNGKSLPSRELLLTLLGVCGIAQQDIPQWLAALERARTSHLPRHPRAVRVADVSPRALGVHASITLDEQDSSLPAYVPRDIDGDLRGVLRRGATRSVFALLVGRSSAGKTRCAYEAMTSVLPAWWLLHPAGADEVREFADAVVPRTVVWLDELQRYLHDGLRASAVESLLRSAEPVVIIGTLWPELYQELTAEPRPGQEDKYPDERRLLRLGEVFDVASQLSAREHSRALEAAEDDSRIALALDWDDYPMTAVLAAAPELVRRWENAPNPCSGALITAAIDSARLGVQAPLLPQVLESAVSGYLTPAERAAADQGWFEQSLAYATRPLRGAAAVLVPVGSAMGQVAGYTVSDYLLQYGSQVRRTAIPPESFWDAYQLPGVSAADQVRLGQQAAHRALVIHAEPLYQLAKRAGDPMGWIRLAELRDRQRRREEAEALLRGAIAAGFQEAWKRLEARIPYNDSDAKIRICREAVSAGYTGLRWPLAGMLTETAGSEEEAEQLLGQEIAAGNLNARVVLAEWLVTLGRVTEAEQLWRKAIADRVENARTGLAGFLREQGRSDEAITALREGLAAGDDPYAWKWLADTLEKEGRIDEAVAARREAIAMGQDINGWSNYCYLLETHGRVDEAVAFLQPYADEGNPGAVEALAGMLHRAGQPDEAVAVLRKEMAESGDTFELWHLTAILREQGKIAEAEEILRESAADNPQASSHLARFLHEQGRAEEAIAAWWDSVEEQDSPYSGIHATHFAEAMVRCGRPEVAEAVRRWQLAVGHPHAVGDLAYLLEQQRRGEEARALRERGLNVAQCSVM